MNVLYSTILLKSCVSELRTKYFVEVFKNPNPQAI